MKVKIVIECDNAAFEPRPEGEVWRILRKVVDKLEQGTSLAEVAAPTLRDINGNTVGRITVEE